MYVVEVVFRLHCSIFSTINTPLVIGTEEARHSWYEGVADGRSLIS
jgi:hypothetical protein